MTRCLSVIQAALKSQSLCPCNMHPHDDYFQIGELWCKPCPYRQVASLDEVWYLVLPLASTASDLWQSLLLVCFITLKESTALKMIMAGKRKSPSKITPPPAPLPFPTAYGIQQWRQFCARRQCLHV